MHGSSSPAGDRRIDHSIFQMTRVREESVRHGSRAGVLRWLAVTGAVITSAGALGRAGSAGQGRP